MRVFKGLRESSCELRISTLAKLFQKGKENNNFRTLAVKNYRRINIGRKEIQLKKRSKSDHEAKMSKETWVKLRKHQF